MGFYKKTDNEITHAPNFVYAPTYVLKIEDKDTYTYPLDGWIHAETLDEAIAKFKLIGVDGVPQSITARQARLAMLQAGLLDQVEEMLSQNKAWSIEWEYASEIERTHPLISVMQQALGLTENQVDELFVTGSLL